MIPDRLQFVTRVAVRSVKQSCHEVLLPIIGREHVLCCVRIVESRNTVVFFHLRQTKMFTLEEGILIKIPGALPLFCSSIFPSKSETVDFSFFPIENLR